MTEEIFPLTNLRTSKVENVNFQTLTWEQAADFVPQNPPALNLLKAYKGKGLTPLQGLQKVLETSLNKPHLE